MCKSEQLRIFPNKERQRDINKLLVKCPSNLSSPGNKPESSICKNNITGKLSEKLSGANADSLPKRCTWIGELGNLDDHLKTHSFDPEQNNEPLRQRNRMTGQFISVSDGLLGSSGHGERASKEEDVGTSVFVHGEMIREQCNNLNPRTMQSQLTQSHSGRPLMATSYRQVLNNAYSVYHPQPRNSSGFPFSIELDMEHVGNANYSGTFYSSKRIQRRVEITHEHSPIAKSDYSHPQPNAIDNMQPVSLQQPVNLQPHHQLQQFECQHSKSHAPETGRQDLSARLE